MGVSEVTIKSESLAREDEYTQDHCAMFVHHLVRLSVHWCFCFDKWWVRVGDGWLTSV